MCVCVCVCVDVRARARVCVCVCMPDASLIRRVHSEEVHSEFLARVQISHGCPCECLYMFIHVEKASASSRTRISHTEFNSTGLNMSKAAETMFLYSFLIQGLACMRHETDPPEKKPSPTGEIWHI